MPDTSWQTFTEHVLFFFHNIWAILSFVNREQSFFNLCYCHLYTDILLKPSLVIMVICPYSQERTIECSLVKELNRKVPLSFSYLKGKVNINQVSMFMKVISSSSGRGKKNAYIAQHWFFFRGQRSDTWSGNCNLTNDSKNKFQTIYNMDMICQSLYPWCCHL